jgi:hypothetical protein
MSHLSRALPFAILLAFSAACSKPAPPAPPASPTSTESPGSASAADQENADFGLRLALLEGHLLVGRELIKAGQVDHALPHFGHPVRELYGDLRPVIDQRHGEQFQTDLVQLESLAASQPNSPQFTTAFDVALEKAHIARDTIPEAVRNSDAYVLHLMADIATTASQEYRNALVAGKIGSLVEYHDARGFMTYASQVIHEHGASANPKIAEARTLVEGLRAMVAPLNPPDPPLGTDAQFEAKAGELRALIAAP